MLDKTTLEKILADPESTAEERELAQRELRAMGEAPSPTGQAVRSAVSPLVAELLRFTGASSFSDVDENDVYLFMEGRPPYQRESLFEEFTAYKIETQRDPQYVAEALEVGRRLRLYFQDSFDHLMKRFRTAIDSGNEQERKAVRRDIMAFLADWKDSCVVPENTKQVFREILGA